MGACLAHLLAPLITRARSERAAKIRDTEISAVSAKVGAQTAEWNADVTGIDAELDRVSHGMDMIYMSCAGRKPPPRSVQGRALVALMQKRKLLLKKREPLDAGTRTLAELDNATMAARTQAVVADVASKVRSVVDRHLGHVLSDGGEKEQEALLKFVEDSAEVQAVLTQTADTVGDSEAVVESDLDDLWKQMQDEDLDRLKAPAVGLPAIAGGGRYVIDDSELDLDSPRNDGKRGGASASSTVLAQQPPPPHALCHPSDSVLLT